MERRRRGWKQKIVGGCEVERRGGRKEEKRAPKETGKEKVMERLRRNDRGMEGRKTVVVVVCGGGLLP